MVFLCILKNISLSENGNMDNFYQTTWPLLGQLTWGIFLTLGSVHAVDQFDGSCPLLVGGWGVECRGNMNWCPEVGHTLLPNPTNLGIWQN